MEPKFSTACLSPFTVELIEKGVLNIVSFSALFLDIVVLSQSNFQRSSVCEIKEDRYNSAGMSCTVEKQQQ